MFGVSVMVVVVFCVMLVFGNGFSVISILVLVLCRILVICLVFSSGLIGLMILVVVFVSSMIGVLMVLGSR